MSSYGGLGDAPGSAVATLEVSRQNLHRQCPETAAVVGLVEAEGRLAFDWLTAGLFHQTQPSLPITSSYIRGWTMYEYELANLTPSTQTHVSTEIP